MELLIAGIAGTWVWFVLSRRPKRDREAAARLQALIGAAMAPKRRPSLATRLSEVGRRVPMRYVGAVLGALFGAFLGPLRIVAIPLLAFAGYKIPDGMSSLRVRARKEDLSRDLPDAVDLLAVCTQAGLNLPLALERVAHGITGPLADELQRTLSEIELGVPRSQALSALAGRVDDEDLEALVGMLQTAERFGTKVAASLTVFAQDVRLRRKRKAEELARKAPVKMLFPLVFLILPGFVLLTLVPLLLGTFESLGF